VTFLCDIDGLIKVLSNYKSARGFDGSLEFLLLGKVGWHLSVVGCSPGITGFDQDYSIGDVNILNLFNCLHVKTICKSFELGPGLSNTQISKLHLGELWLNDIVDWLANTKISNQSILAHHDQGDVLW